MMELNLTKNNFIGPRLHDKDDEKLDGCPQYGDHADSGGHAGPAGRLALDRAAGAGRGRGRHDRGVRGHAHRPGHRAHRRALLRGTGLYMGTNM